MRKVEKAVAPGQGATTANQNAFSSKDKSILAEKKAGRKKGVKKKKKFSVTMISVVKSLSIKVYDEQLPGGESDLDARVQQASKEDGWRIVKIKHDMDLIGDDFWQPSTEKPHYHIIVEKVSAQGGKMAFRVSTVLNLLHIVYRQGVDDDMISGHGVETIKKGYSAMLMYLTHETPDAIADGKHTYSRDALVSNLSKDELDRIRDGYVRLSASEARPDYGTLAELDQVAYKLGMALKDFTSWYRALPPGVRRSGTMRTIKESYSDGVKEALKTKHEVTRCSVFIEGRPGVGKTYAAQYALRGKKVLEVSGGGTGRFDALDASTDAIVLSDSACPNLLNLTDNYVCQAYRRNSSNPPWCGAYFIVTSNDNFETWAEKCRFPVKDDYDAYTEQYKALKERFYICKVIEKEKSGLPYLHVESVESRGGKEDQKAHDELFAPFKAAYEESLRENAKRCSDQGLLAYKRPNFNEGENEEKEE